MADALFEIPDGARIEHAPKLAGDKRTAQLQLEKLAAGYHPITGLKLHEQAAPADDRDAPGRRCGTCRFRVVLPYHRKSWPKCLNPGGMGADEIDRIGAPFVTHGAATDVRKWFPGCRDHSYGDPRVSEDAARWVPDDDGGEHA